MAFTQGTGGSGTGQGYGEQVSGSDSGGGSGTSGGGSGSSLSNIPKIVLVGSLLLTLLLLLANHFPKFTTGFMLLVLAGVVLSHASIITSFFNTNG